METEELKNMETVQTQKNESRSSREITRASNDAKPLLDGIFRIGSLSPELIDLLKSSRAPASRRAMFSDLRLFSNWHKKKFGENENIFPAGELAVAEFIADISVRRRVSSITRYCSSLSKFHDLNGWGNPTKTVLVSGALSGLRKTKKTSQKKAPALRARDLVKILSELSSTEWASRRNQAILSVGWGAALRSSEIVSLDLADVEKREGGVVITIKKLLAEHILAWRYACERLYGHNAGPLFPRLGCSKTDRWFPAIHPRPRLSVRGLSKIISTIFKSFGLSGSAHSLRRGLITEAAAMNVPEILIQRHSRHASVRVLRSYVEDGNIFNQNTLLPIIETFFRGQ